MYALREQQLAFAAALTGSAAELAAMAAPGSRVSLAASAAIYRNNVREGFRKALALAFPVVERLVAPDYFRQLAGRFQERHPSRSGNLNDIGAPFADFLLRQFGDTDFAYLVDIARLEWACQEVTYAAAETILGVRSLQAIDPDHYPELRLRVQPAIRLLQSRYPIVAIWSSNQPGAAAETIDLCAGGDCVLVVRRMDGIALHRLTPACYQLASALQAGAPLGEAVDAAGLASAPSELGTALHRLFAMGTFSGLQE